ELEYWCQDKSTIPQSEDEPFIVSFYRHYKDDTDHDDDENVVDDGNNLDSFCHQKDYFKLLRFQQSYMLMPPTN
ncbi:unnamed protein product, partial [Didymodactylos carnosus]